MQCLPEWEGERVKGEERPLSTPQWRLQRKQNHRGWAWWPAQRRRPGWDTFDWRQEAATEKKLKTAKKAHNFLMRIYFVRQANDRPRLCERERESEGEGDNCSHCSAAEIIFHELWNIFRVCGGGSIPNEGAPESPRRRKCRSHSVKSKVSVSGSWESQCG